MVGRLEGRVALVAGATRRAGRGIAVALGAAGATVYCTGRSTAGRRSEYDRPETIEETAALVTAAGGTGVAVRVDHPEPAEMAGLLRRIDAGRGRLDVLVDDVWAASGCSSGTPRSGSMISRPGCAWPSIRTSSRATTRCRSSSGGPVGWWSR